MENVTAVTQLDLTVDRKAYFHIMDLSFLNSSILLTSDDSKISYRNIRISLVREPI
jgi:hypothetical protein